MSKAFCIIFIVIGFFFFSCSKLKEEKPIATLTFSMQSIEKSWTAEEDSTRQIAVTFSYPLFSGDSPAAPAMNQLIKNILLSTVYGDSVDVPVEEAAQFFIDLYADEMRELGVSQRWELSENITVAFQSEKVLTLRVDDYVFTGGAHGLHGTIFYNFDLISGRELSLADFLKPDGEDDMEKIAERKFRQIRQIPEAQSLSDAGYWFENDRFYLPDNFAVLADGLLFLYNHYEIAPFAEGMIELPLSYDELSPVLAR